MSRDDDAQVSRLEQAYLDQLAAERAGNEVAARQARARFEAARRASSGPEKLRFLLRAPGAARPVPPRARRPR